MTPAQRKREVLEKLDANYPSYSIEQALAELEAIDLEIYTKMTEELNKMVDEKDARIAELESIKSDDDCVKTCQEIAALKAALDKSEEEGKDLAGNLFSRTQRIEKLEKQVEELKAINSGTTHCYDEAEHKRMAERIADLESENMVISNHNFVLEQSLEKKSCPTIK